MSWKASRRVGVACALAIAASAPGPHFAHGARGGGGHHALLAEPGLVELALHGIQVHRAAQHRLDVPAVRGIVGFVVARTDVVPLAEVAGRLVLVPLPGLPSIGQRASRTISNPHRWEG